MGRVFSTGVEAFSATTIRITFSYFNERCREPLKLEPTTTNLKRAQQHRALILDAIAKGTFDYAATFPHSKRLQKLAAPERGTTIEARYKVWIARQKKQLKASTLVGYDKISKQFLPALGGKTLTELTRVDVRTWLETLDVGNKRLANIQSVIRAMLTDAVEDGLLEINPLHDWTFRNRDVIKAADDVQPFTLEEQLAILNQLQGQGHNLIKFAFWTGLRTSELIGLEWGDIDWIRGSFHVRRAFTQAAAEPEVPKTHSSFREVKLLPPALEALVQQKQHTFLAGGAVFHDPATNARWAGDIPIRQRLWTSALRRAKVLYRRPYQTRHTYASMMLTAGESPMWVAQQMGHSDWGMIRRTYGKFIADAQPDAGMKATAMFATQEKCGQQSGHDRPL